MELTSGSPSSPLLVRLGKRDLIVEDGVKCSFSLGSANPDFQWHAWAALVTLG